MVKKLLLLFVLLIVFTSLKAQEEDVGWVSRFGIALGVNPVYIFPNLDDVNQQVKKMGLTELPNSGFLTWGGGGYAYIMMIDNIRIGGLGLSGSTSSSKEVDGYAKEVKYNFGLGGLTVEYTLPFIKNVAVSLGAIVGMGSISIEIYQSNLDYTWENLWSKVSNGILITSEVSDILTQSFFIFSPTLNCDIPLTRFMSFRIGGGYNITFNKDWKINNNRNISGVPSTLNGKMFFVQTGIYLGFFAY